MKRFVEQFACRRSAIYLVLFVCLALRATYAWHCRHVPPIGDGTLYSEIAKQLAAGHGLAWKDLSPTAWGCPLYPALIALQYRFISTAPLATYLLQAAVDTLTCFVVFRMALHSIKRPIVAVAAALCYSLYLPFVVMIGTFWADTVGYFFLAVAVYALLLARDRGGRYFALTGVLMGLAILVKPMLLAFPVSLAFMLLLMGRKQRSLIAGAGWLVFAAYLTVCPWTIRNYVVFGRFIPVASHSGQTLWCGTGPADGKTINCWNAPVDSRRLNLIKDPETPDVSDATYARLKAFQKRLAGMDEIARNDALMKAAVDEIRQHPGRYAVLAVKKFFRLWFHLFQDNYRSHAVVLIALVNSVLLLLAVLGWRSRRVDQFLAWTTINFAAYTSVLTMITFAHVRYSYPVFPFIIIFAVAGVVHLTGVDGAGRAECEPVAADMAAV